MPCVLRYQHTVLTVWMWESLVTANPREYGGQSLTRLAFCVMVVCCCRHCLGVLMAPNADGPVKFATSADH